MDSHRREMAARGADKAAEIANMGECNNDNPTTPELAIQRLESWLAVDEMRTAVISLGPCGSINVSLTEHRIEPEENESEVEQWEVTEQSPLEIAILNALKKANE